jgi:hypothetical protein
MQNGKKRRPKKWKVVAALMGLALLIASIIYGPARVLHTLKVAGMVLVVIMAEAFSGKSGRGGNRNTAG